MLNTISNLLAKNKLVESGQRFFLIGIFFLPSALTVSAIFLLISLMISIKKSNSTIFNIKSNLPIILSIGLIIFSCLNITFIDKPKILYGHDFH